VSLARTPQYNGPMKSHVHRRKNDCRPTAALNLAASKTSYPALGGESPERTCQIAQGEAGQCQGKEDQVVQAA
jgi:hypothetical protein